MSTFRLLLGPQFTVVDGIRQSQGPSHVGMKRVFNACGTLRLGPYRQPPSVDHALLQNPLTNTA